VKNVNTSFTAVIHKEDDIYVAECPEVGTVSQGYTIDKHCKFKRSYRVIS
jgi:hypothetical protein